ncbi:MAG: hypothetical protein AAGH40_02875 [Verrucomicrobiota bacterium]
MKIIITLLLFCVTSFALANPPEIDEFLDSVSEACKKKDIEEIRSLTYTEGSHPILIDYFIANWEFRFSKKHPADTYSFDSLSFMPLQEAKKRVEDQILNPRALAFMTEPQIRNGSTYTPNLSELVGYITINWLNEGRPAGSNMHPVYRAPDGSLKFSTPMLKRG